MSCEGSVAKTLGDLVEGQGSLLLQINTSKSMDTIRGQCLNLNFLLKYIKGFRGKLRHYQFVNTPAISIKNDEEPGNFGESSIRLRGRPDEKN
jgi:hypothetical protein